MSARLPQPALAFEPGGVFARLARDYRVAAWPASVAIRAGFRYDGASVPAPLRPLVGGPWDPVRLPAATAHDWLYASHAVPKWMADLVFLRLLAANGMPPWRALADWWAVARFGGPAWRSHGPGENHRALTLGEISVFGLRVESGNDKTKDNKKQKGKESMKRLVCAALVAAACAGCMRAITIEKNDPIPVGTDGNAFIDGGYVFRYRNVGLKTDVSSISAEKTEKGVTIKVRGVATDVSGENKEIVGAGGTAIGNVAEKVIEGVKGVETVKAK